MNNITLAKILFDNWKSVKIADGYHLPTKCPVYARNADNFDSESNADIIHCSKCNSLLVEFSELPKVEQDNYLEKATKYLDTYGD